MKTRHHILTALLIVAGCILISQIAPGDVPEEKILDFRSDIKIHQDGSMTVTETIKVVSAGKQIRRGIFRTFPTRYRDRYGNTVRVDFEVEAVLKDGAPEPYHLEQMSNGVKVYAGRSDVYLRHGEYTYTITYRTDRQIGFFKDFDELYWNVTGNDWAFVIDRAEAVVTLPPGANPINTAAYTGPQGAQGQNFIMQTDASGIRWTTTRPLLPEEGLTVAVSFTKGIIPEPTLKQKAGYLFSDNRSATAGLIGLGVLLIYYLIVWAKVGKDPEKGTIIPHLKPPEGYSPAAVRYVMRMGYSDKVFAAAIISMAVKKYLTIHEHNGKFTLSRTYAAKSPLTRGEQKIAKKLFGTRSEIELQKKNHAKIGGAITALKKTLKTDFEKLNFRRNGSYAIPGFLFSLVTLVAIVLSTPMKEGALFMSIWLFFWTGGCFFLVRTTLQAWRSVFAGGRDQPGQKGAALFLTFFSLPFVGAEVVVLIFFSSMISAMSILLLFILIFVNILFYQLLKAPTVIGRKVMDVIEGFKMYLETAEEERLDILHPPDRTPELFERYLPYALALDVENEWSEKFSDVLAKASAGQEYSPGWYTGRNWSRIGTTGMVSSLSSSFSSAISSSSTAPGSSSGSSGGGSSGGGGGGGGGGGW